VLDGKLQIKQGQRVAVTHAPYDLDLAAPRADPGTADAVVVFATNRAELDERRGELDAAARRGALTWLAYPKAKQLGTDLDRDSIREYALAHGLDTVRQVAIDETWSALRLKPTG
jgi:hypothetical protein